MMRNMPQTVPSQLGCSSEIPYPPSKGETKASLTLYETIETKMLALPKRHNEFSPYMHKESGNIHDLTFPARSSLHILAWIPQRLVAGLDLVLDSVIPGLVDLRLEVEVHELRHRQHDPDFPSLLRDSESSRPTSPFSGVHCPSVSR